MSPEPHDVADLLGAYAIDAVDPEEARRVEEHLENCPRCRAEVAAHRETAALLAHAGSDAPDGIWQRIADEVGEDNRTVVPFELRTVKPRPGRPTIRRRWLAAAWAVAAAAIALLGVAVGHLDGEVSTLQSAERSSGLAPLVISALTAPHTDVALTSSTGTRSASVVITPAGSAYWLGSSLSQLPKGRTYQLWGEIDGRYVSVDVLGNVPSRLAEFDIGPGVRMLLVTSEPKGGTTAPTTPVLVAGPVPTPQ